MEIEKFNYCFFICFHTLQTNFKDETDKNIFLSLSIDPLNESKFTAGVEVQEWEIQDHAVYRSALVKRERQER